MKFPNTLNKILKTPLFIAYLGGLCLMSITLYSPDAIGELMPFNMNPVSRQLAPVAVSPNPYRFISQHESTKPKVFCGPTSLTMAFSPYLDAQNQAELLKTVERFAEILHTDSEKGTRVEQMLQGIETLQASKVFHTSWQPVRYDGIHHVARSYYDGTWFKIPAWPQNTRALRKSISRGDLVLGHLGWYQQNEKRQTFERKGGHYVLLTGIYTDEAQPMTWFLEMLDPLEAEDSLTQGLYTLKLNPVEKSKHRFKVEDAQGQFTPRLVKGAWMQPYPPTGKKEEVLTFVEGLLILRQSK